MFCPILQIHETFSNITRNMTWIVRLILHTDSILEYTLSVSKSKQRNNVFSGIEPEKLRIAKETRIKRWDTIQNLGSERNMVAALFTVNS